MPLILECVLHKIFGPGDFVCATAKKPHPTVPLQGRNQKSHSPGPIWALTFIHSNTKYSLVAVSHWLALEGQHIYLTGKIEPYREQLGPESYYVEVDQDAQMNITIYRAATPCP